MSATDQQKTKPTTDANGEFLEFSSRQLEILETLEDFFQEKETKTTSSKTEFVHC